MDATETDIAYGIMKIAAGQKNRICTFKRAYSEIPSVVKLSNNNRLPSIKRPREVMWQQLVRNIKCHYNSDNNFIKVGYLEHVPHVGYRITNLGLKSYNSLG